MALLGDALFPDAATHEYFKEEMGGRLDVTTDYDSITITLQGRASDYDRIVDILRSAIVTTPLSPENVAKVRESRIKALNGAKRSPAEIADQAVAGRLFGTFPYARPVGGTVESLARINRSDLMLARERFLNASNATLAIVGGVDERRAMRALRQLLGGWNKGNQVVPATFRQPDSPNARPLIVESPGANTAEVRLAMRGLARSDRDYFAAALLAMIARDRWQKLSPELSPSATFVRHEAHFLPSIFVMGASVDNSSAAKTLESARAALKSLVEAGVSATEMEALRARLNVPPNDPLRIPETIADEWLDVDTHGLSSMTEQTRLRNSVSAADLQRVAARLFRDNTQAAVVVGNSAQLKANFAKGTIDVMGEDGQQKAKAAEQKPPKSPEPETKATAPMSAVPATKSTRAVTKPD
jgi:zinc protease